MPLWPYQGTIYIKQYMRRVPQDALKREDRDVQRVLNTFAYRRSEGDYRFCGRITCHPANK